MNILEIIHCFPRLSTNFINSRFRSKNHSRLVSPKLLNLVNLHLYQQNNSFAYFRLSFNPKSLIKRRTRRNFSVLMKHSIMKHVDNSMTPLFRTSGNFFSEPEWATLFVHLGGGVHDVRYFNSPYVQKRGINGPAKIFEKRTSTRIQVSKQIHSWNLPRVEPNKEITSVKAIKELGILFKKCQQILSFQKKFPDIEIYTIYSSSNFHHKHQLCVRITDFEQRVHINNYIRRFISTMSFARDRLSLTGLSLCVR